MNKKLNQKVKLPKIKDGVVIETVQLSLRLSLSLYVGLLSLC